MLRIRGRRSLQNVGTDQNYLLLYQVRKVGKVFRAIAIMSHPIPNTADSHSVQIIIPQKQLGRKSDMQVFCISPLVFIHYWALHLQITLGLLVISIIVTKECSLVHARYVFCCSYSHNVASKGKFIAFVSAQAESENPAAELKPGIDLLGPVDELFIDTYDRFEPTNDPSSDNCFISTVSHRRNIKCMQVRHMTKKLHLK